MDLSFSEDQIALRDLARQIFDGHVTQDRLKEVEAGPDWFDRALWTELARANLLGAGVPEEHGGIGGGLIEVCILLEEAGRAVAPVPLLHTLATGALPLARFGSPSQKASWLPKIVSGDARLSAALAEEVPSLTVRDEHVYGTVSFVPFAHLAQRILVPTVAGLFLADPASSAKQRQVATNREQQAIVTFDGAAAERLGDVAAVRWLKDLATVAYCAVGVGVAERALRLTADYLSQREQFGRVLGTFQAVQQRMADSYIDVEAMRWTMWQAAWRLEEGLQADEEIAIAKFWAAEAGQRVVSAAQHLHGGIGVDLEYPLHRYTSWSKQVELSLGASYPQLERLGNLMVERMA